MNIVGVVLMHEPELPPIRAMGYEYVVAGNGLFIRAEDSRIEALVPVAAATLHGLTKVEPFARLKLPRVPARFLKSILNSARKRIPREAMYQLVWKGGERGARERGAWSEGAESEGAESEGRWHCLMPHQEASETSLDYIDEPLAVIDVHSHHVLSAFFSQTDDDDETGLRFYAVLGRLDLGRPEIAVRVGVYGHRWDLPAETVFETGGLVDDVFEREPAGEETYDNLEARARDLFPGDKEAQRKYLDDVFEEASR